MKPGNELARLVLVGKRHPCAVCRPSSGGSGEALGSRQAARARPWFRQAAPPSRELLSASRLSMHSYSTTVILSGAQPPWKPNGTRTGRRIVAIGSPAKSWASRMTTSLRSRSGS